MKTTMISTIGGTMAIAISLLMAFMPAAETEAREFPVLKDLMPGDGSNIEAEVLSTILISSAPSSPRDLRTLAGDNVVYLTWIRPKDLNGAVNLFYVIQRSYDGGSTWKNLTKVDGQTTVFEDRCVANGLLLKYRIVAVGDDLWSEPSDISVARPVGAPYPPAGVHAVVEGSVVQIGWKYPLCDGGSPIRGYVLFRKTDAETSFREIIRFNESVTSWTDTSVQGNSSVAYYLKAVNSAGISLGSIVVKVEEVPTDPEEIQEDRYDLQTLSLIGGVSLGLSFVGIVLWSSMKIMRRKAAPTQMIQDGRQKVPSIVMHVKIGQGSST